MILNWCSIAAIVRGRGGHRGRGSCHFQFATSHAFLIIQWLCIVRHFGLFRYQLNLMTVPMSHVGFMLISLRGQLGLLSIKRRLAVESNSDCWSAPSCFNVSQLHQILWCITFSSLSQFIQIFNSPNCLNNWDQTAGRALLTLTPSVRQLDFNEFILWIIKVQLFATRKVFSTFNKVHISDCRFV